MLLLALAMTTLAACGSDDSEDSSSSGAVTTADSGDAGGDVVAAATEKYEAAATEPDTFKGPTEPVAAKTGISVGIVACDAKLSGCSNPGKAVKTIVEEELDGTAKIYDGASDPKKMNEAILQMVAEDVDGIVLQSIPPEVVGQGLDAAAAKKIPVVRCCGSGGSPNEEIDTGGKVFAHIDLDYAAAGEASAAYVTAASGGKANVLLLDDNSQAGVKGHVGGFRTALEELCPDCEQDTMQTTTADVTTATPQRVVDYLRTHSDVDWIYLGYDPQGIFIVPALQKAGMKDIKIAGILANPVNIDFIKKGQNQVSDVAYDETYYGWAMLDQIQRALNDMPATEPMGQDAPWYLITKENENYPTGATESTGWTAPFDYAAEYRKLWGLS